MAGQIKIKWGNISLNDKKYHDVLIYSNTIEERDYDRLKKEFVTSHKIGNWEIEKLLQGSPETIVIGTGYFDAVKVPDELKDETQKNNIELQLLKSPKAVKEYNFLILKKKKVSALIHSTC